MDNLLKHLYFCWASTIETMKIDPLAHKIELELKILDNGVEYDRLVVFEGVASYFFAANRKGERRGLFSPEQGDILELSSLEFYKDGVGTVGFLDVQDKWAENWAHEYEGIMNFRLEMTCKTLLIEADRGSFDGEEFFVGYPQDSRMPLMWLGDRNGCSCTLYQATDVNRIR